jgi:hypothetical protein
MIDVLIVFEILVKVADFGELIVNQLLTKNEAK